MTRLTEVSGPSKAAKVSSAVSSESVSSSEPKKKLPSRTVNMVELSYGDFQVLQFPYVDLTWDEAKNFCDNIGIEFHQNLTL